MISDERGQATRAVTTHYIDGALVEFHGREIMSIARPYRGRSRSLESEQSFLMRGELR